MKNKPFVILLISVMILGPSACGLFQSCPEAMPYFQIEGMQLTHNEFENSTSGDPLSEDNKVAWNDYGLRADFKSIYHASKSLEPNWGTNLYALSCIEPGYMGSQLGVDTLYLVTLNEYNDEYTANDTLNEIILINDWAESSTFYKLEDYIAENKEVIQFQNFTIKLTEGPTEDSSSEFELIYILTSGQEFKQKSSVVNLSK